MTLWSLPITGARIRPVDDPLTAPEHLVARSGIRQPNAPHMAPQSLRDAEQILGSVALGRRNDWSTIQGVAPTLFQPGQVAIHVQDHQAIAASPGKHTNCLEHPRLTGNLERNVSRPHHDMVRLLQGSLALALLTRLKVGPLDINRCICTALGQLVNKRQQLLRLLRHSVRLLQNIGNYTPKANALGVFLYGSQGGNPVLL